MKKVESSSNYRVGEGEVRLRVTIGDGHFGSTLVTVGPTVFGQERTFDRPLGSGAQLRGKTVRVLSVVTDTNEQTNRTSVTYRLTGGPEPLEQTASFTVSEERESVDYEATFTLE